MASYSISYPGPPTTGTYAINDTVVDSAGVTWYCTASGINGATFVSRSLDDDAVVTTLSVSSGVGFIPSATRRSEVIIPCTHAGTVTLTAGPSTGAENTYLSTFTVVAGTVITKTVPAGWTVIVTLASSATIGTVAVQTL